MNVFYKILILSGMMLLYYPTDNFAQYPVEAHVSYETEDEGFSDFYTREIELISGFQLNRNTNSRDYSMSSDYVLIWFGQNEVAIIELESVRFSSPGSSQITDAAYEMTKRVHGLNHKGTDQEEVRWKICFASPDLKGLCR